MMLISTDKKTLYNIVLVNTIQDFLQVSKMPDL